MNKTKINLNSVRIRLFLTLAVSVISIILFLILLNNVVLERFHIYSKKNTLLTVYKTVNYYYNDSKEVDIEEELNNIASKYNFDLSLRTDTGLIVFTTDIEKFIRIDDMDIGGPKSKVLENKDNIIYNDQRVNIKKVEFKNKIG